MQYDSTLRGITEVTLSANTAVTLAVALAASSYGQTSVQDGLRQLLLIPASSVTVNIAFGNTASASYPALPAGGIQIECGARDAASISLFSTAGGGLAVYQIGNRRV